MDQAKGGKRGKVWGGGKQPLCGLDKNNEPKGARPLIAKGPTKKDTTKSSYWFIPSSPKRGPVGKQVPDGGGGTGGRGVRKQKKGGASRGGEKEVTNQVIPFERAVRRTDNLLVRYSTKAS